MKPCGLFRNADKIYRSICHGDLGMACAATRLGSTMPDLTAVRYKVKREPFGEITGTHVNFFEQLLGHNRVITDPNECDSYNVDWIKMVRGSSRLVLKPNSTEEVSEILKYCNDNNLAVCPQSGNTGLVGGSVPVFDEIVLSMKMMNKIISTDELSGALVCEAGCILEVLENHVEQYGLMMPLDLGAKGSCLIGGNISTNAGGQRLLRYGNLHGSVLGLEAVTANGRIIDSMSTLKKDNTGYHLKNLFIGSEGTLGVVTKVAIQCPTRPLAQNVAFVGLNSFDKVLKTFVLAKKKLAEILSACEMIDSWSLGISVDLLHLKSPLSQDHKFYMLIETSGSNQKHDEEKLTSFVETALSEELIEDGTLSGDPTKIKKIWEIRERLGEGCLLDGYCFKYDVSLPLPHFYKLIEALHERLDTSRVVRISGFGHLGDGNLHVVVATPKYDPEIESQLEPFLFEYVSEQRGSVSAEHGIGFKKTKYLSYSKNASAIHLMKEIKNLMDPRGILNPYKVLP
ncbi:D-2-hydroxyglutarate dehydrogenase, mitochondrial [Microplitis demolitor]|uniref:D-2-hydroxyglutarate dehydrogenase, mitochondrial n=1 Tax=Microplitis demolitor TaxID=69319 RepID=UPI00043FFE4F|nr:D-2-hydroxyglutarate dehydrogenase, mitochondrial [Microplitis demolitor]XP_053595970.1 D-2-hydroxyglutarate dehydrogenase, mitochondrial [Microplitis demolitor]